MENRSKYGGPEPMDLMNLRCGVPDLLACGQQGHALAKNLQCTKESPLHRAPLAFFAGPVLGRHYLR